MRDDERPFVAEVYDVQTGELFDRCWTWETGQNYAAGRDYLVIAIADDGYMTVDEAQRLYDYERRIYLDCFGEE